MIKLLFPIAHYSVISASFGCEISLLKLEIILFVINVPFLLLRNYFIT